MSDESTTTLREIAELLKKRVEQEDAVAFRAIESRKRGEEFSARFKGQAEEAKARSEVMHRNSEEMRKQFTPENREKTRAEMELRRDEERQFRESLLSELQRHNALLTEIIGTLRKSQAE